METIDLKIFESPAVLAEEAASYWWQFLKTNPGPVSVAISGGRIARNFFQEIVKRRYESEVRLDQVALFWADERCVPPTHEESNYKLAKDNLLDLLGIPSSSVYRIRGELPPADAAAQAQEEMEKWMAASARFTKAGFPMLDIVFLGMGEDGHVASLFPEGPRPSSCSDWFLSVVASKPPPQRISMNYPLIENAKEVVVLASGVGKEAALRESLAPHAQTPLAHVLNRRHCTRIFTDITL